MQITTNTFVLTHILGSFRLGFKVFLASNNNVDTFLDLLKKTLVFLYIFTKILD